MSRPTVSTNTIAGGTTLSAATLNTLADRVAIALNTHTHDPGSSASGYGKGVPQWGPSNSLYASLGPGSSTWSSSLQDAAAIPADSNQTALAPTTAVTAAMGVGAELAVIRGAINALVGQSVTTSWGTTPPPSTLSLAQLNPASQQSGTINVSGSITTAAQIISTAATGTAPLVVSSTTAIPNLNAGLLADQNGVGHAATSVYGAGYGGRLLTLDGNGLYPLAAVEYDGAEATTLDVLTSGTSTLQNTLNRLRFTADGFARAAGLPGFPSVPATLVTTVNASGNPALSGPVSLVAGSGIGVTQTGNQIQIALTGSAPASGGSVTYSDWWLDAVEAGLGLSYSPQPAAAPTASGSTAAGTIPAGTYTVGFTWTGPAGESILSATTSVTLGATGEITVTIPALPGGLGVNVTSANIYLNNARQSAGVAPGTVTLTSYSSTGVASPGTSFGCLLGTGVAYIAGARQTLAANAAATALSNVTCYIDWTGSAVNVTTTATPAAGAIRLWQLATSTTQITSVTDVRPSARPGVSPVINVRDYGAVGNGVADDTAALATAVTLHNRTGRPLYFPDGTYTTTQPLIFTSYCTVSGAGYATTIVATANLGTTGLITVTGNSAGSPYRISIRDLRLNANSNASYALFINYTTETSAGALLQNLYSYGATSYQYRFIGTEDMYVHNIGTTGAPNNENAPRALYWHAPGGNANLFGGSLFGQCYFVCAQTNIFGTTLGPIVLDGDTGGTQGTPVGFWPNAATFAAYGAYIYDTNSNVSGGVGDGTGNYCIDTPSSSVTANLPQVHLSGCVLIANAQTAWLNGGLRQGTKISAVNTIFAWNYGASTQTALYLFRGGGSGRVQIDDSCNVNVPATSGGFTPPVRAYIPSANAKTLVECPNNNVSPGDGTVQMPAPTIAVGGQLGTGGSVSILAGSTDRSGYLTFTTGSNATAGSMASVTFASAFDGKTPIVRILPARSGYVQEQESAWVYTATNTGFSIAMGNAPALNSQYEFTYFTDFE